jgi:hypothetical protein
MTGIRIDVRLKAHGNRRTWQAERADDAMTWKARDRRSTDGFEWRQDRAGAVGVAIAALLCLLLSLLMLGSFAWALQRPDWMAALVLIALAGLQLTLATYCAHAALGRWGGSIAVTPRAIILDLPAWRSLVQDAPAVRERIDRSDIDSVEARLEALESLGMSALQRSYRLLLRNGRGILLFESRALATLTEDPRTDTAAREIAQALELNIVDRGMVLCQGGLLGMGATAPSWLEAPLAVDQQHRVWRRASLTGAAGSLAMLIALLVKALQLLS